MRLASLVHLIPRLLRDVEHFQIIEDRAVVVCVSRDTAKSHACCLLF